MNNILIKFSLSKGTCSLTPQICNYFATKMQATSTNKTKDSAGRRLGVKKFGGEEVFPNDIIIRQRGFKWKPGKNIIIGKDHTFHSKIEGKVKFDINFAKKHKKTIVSVEPARNPNRIEKPPMPYCYHPELFPERAAFNPPPCNYPLRQPKKKKAEKTTYWLGKKAENDNYFSGIRIPENYEGYKILSPPQLEFKVHPF